VAVKCIARVKLSKATEANLVQEISLLQELRHRNILSIIDFHCPYNGDVVYIVTELCEGGDLAQLLSQRQSDRDGDDGDGRRGLELAQTKTLLQQLASALAYLRSCHVAHFDLKPSNLLLRTWTTPAAMPTARAARAGKRENESGENERRLLPPVLVVADFGFAARMEDESFKASVRGSPLYLAPEMWREGSYDARWG
jgi:serine/threonine protein kinase